MGMINRQDAQTIFSATEIQNLLNVELANFGQPSSYRLAGDATSIDRSYRCSIECLLSL